MGRYFRLEGSGHPKEREGSRFSVRPTPLFPLSFFNIPARADRAPCRLDNMGAFLLPPSICTHSC